jgi:hypothetical protein
MDFIDTLKQYAARLPDLLPKLRNEEQTKLSLIQPFFAQVLGYDVTNPDEFLPECVADVGAKKGEKVDYCIFLDGSPAIIIEAKWCGEPLEKHDGQLYRYFATSKAKFAVLTNGVIYRFYTDLEKEHLMDSAPFLELDLLRFRDTIVPELKRFCKSEFKSDEIFDRASELKYSNDIKKYFAEQLMNPSDDFVRDMLTLSKTYEKMKTAVIIEKFKPIVKTALNSFINETMNDRISSALNPPQKVTADESEVVEEPETKSKIVTTEDELQAFYIIKAILGGEYDISKITYKDTQNYFAVLYSGMVTKWICRLRLGTKSSIAFPVGSKGEEERQPIDSIDDIYKFKDRLFAAADRYYPKASPKEEPVTVG